MELLDVDLDGSEGFGLEGLEDIWGDEASHEDFDDLRDLEPGSPEARVAVRTWHQKMVAQGEVADHPLQRGPHRGDGDFNEMVTRIYYQHGDLGMAQRIAGRVQNP